MEIQAEPYVRWPKPLKTDASRRNKDQYCRYHKDHGHDTEECRQLKDEIEFLIRKGHLDRFVNRETKMLKGRDSRGDRRERNGQWD